MTGIREAMAEAGVETLGELAEKMRAEATPEELAAAREEDARIRARIEEELHYCDDCGDPLPVGAYGEPEVCELCLLCVAGCCDCEPEAVEAYLGWS